MSDEPTAGPPGPTPKKRRRRPRGKPQGPAPLGPDPLARTLAELDRLATALAREAGVERAPDTELVIPLTIWLGPPRDPAARAAAFTAQLRERVQEAVRGVAAFREGHVYCFYTDQPESPYSRPPNDSAVFAGYSANGKPEWIGFANLCLRRHEERVDRLYGDSPEVLAVVQLHDELEAGLLPGFGRDSRAYRLLGQVAFGFVPKDLRTRQSSRIALTLQVVATTQSTSAQRLRLNVLGLSPEAIAEAAAESDASSAAEAFRMVLRGTRERIDALGRRMALANKRGETLAVDALVRQLLGRLRGDVLRVFKLRDYRTRHAEERHQSGERPTSLAITDALAATDGRFYRDDRKDTVVVAGPKHRIHVFSREGRLVTSLELLPAELERRVERGRWRPLERLASEVFKDSLRKARSHE